MKYYMMKYNDNWADEMDIDGICFITQDKVDLFNQGVKQVDDMEFYIGTNESIDYEDEESVLDRVEFKEITKYEYDLFIKNIGSIGFADSLLEYVIDLNDNEYGS